VRYTGNELNRGGSVIIYRSNNNESVGYPLTASVMLQNKECVTVPVDREWHYNVYKPTSAPGDVGYEFIVSNVYPNMIMIQGATAGMSFEYDWVTWFEVIGAQVPNLTPSSSDPLGLAVVKSASAVNQPVNTPSQNWSNFLDEVSTIAGDTLSFIGRGIGAVAPIVPFLTSTGLL
jgi:hypothetical protein